MTTPSNEHNKGNNGPETGGSGNPKTRSRRSNFGDALFLALQDTFNLEAQGHDPDGQALVPHRDPLGNLQVRRREIEDPDDARLDQAVRHGLGMGGRHSQDGDFYLFPLSFFSLLHQNLQN